MKKRENWDEMDWEKDWLRDKILKLKSISKPQFLALQLKIIKYLLGAHIWYITKDNKNEKSWLKMIEKVKIPTSKTIKINKNLWICKVVLTQAET